MSTVFPIVFFIVSVLVSFVVVGAVIYLIVFLVKRKDTSPIKLSIDLLLKVYLYIISFVTLIVAVIGGTMLLRSASSYAFGIPFSYSTYPANVYDAEYQKDPTYTFEKCYQSEPVMFGDKEICFSENERKQDLVNGATFLISMLILFGIHQWGIWKLEKKNVTQWLKKTYIFVSLIMYSIVGVIIIPVSIYQLSTHLLYRVNDVTSSYEAPGIALSLMLLSVPLWIYFLVKTFNLKETEEKE